MIEDGLDDQPRDSEWPTPSVACAPRAPGRWRQLAPAPGGATPILERRLVRGAAPEPRAGAARPDGRAVGAAGPEPTEPANVPAAREQRERGAATDALVADVLRMAEKEAMGALAHAVRLLEMQPGNGRARDGSGPRPKLVGPPGEAGATSKANKAGAYSPRHDESAPPA